MKKLFLFLFVALLSQNVFAQINFKFHWRQISGPLTVTIVNPDSASTLVTGLNMQGFYDFEFSVTNDFGTGLDTCRVTVLGTVLSIPTDTLFHLERPEIKKLEIKSITRASDIYLQIKSPRTQRIDCVIYDVTGRALAKIEMHVTKGISFASIPKPRVSGVYIIRFITYYENITNKIVM